MTRAESEVLRKLSALGDYPSTALGIERQIREAQAALREAGIKATGPETRFLLLNR